MLFQISSVAASATPADALTCKSKTSWKWLLVWGFISFQTLRREVNLRLDFGGTSILMLHTKSSCAWLLPRQGSPLHLWQVCAWSYRKRWSLSMWLRFPSCMWWDGCLVSWNMIPKSRSNARAYSRVLSPSTSGSDLPYPIPQCTLLYPVPAQRTWPFWSSHGIRNSDPGILAVTASSWSKNRSLTSSLRPLCKAYTDRKIMTRWPTISFAKMILSETLCTSKTFSIHSSATNTPTSAVPLLFPDH